MHIFVRTLTGRTLTLAVQPSNTIDAVKAHVQDRLEFPVAMQRLIFDHKSLDAGTLAHYGVGDQCMLFLVLRLRGGCVGRLAPKAGFE